MMEVYLRTMSDGRNHPAAQCPTIHYFRSGARASYTHSLSITNSRLVVVAKLWGSNAGFAMFVWDWNSSQVLFVRLLFPHVVLQVTQAVIQELEFGHYASAEFIDDYRLLITRDSRPNLPPCLVLIDTGKDMGGTPIQTTFQLSPHIVCFARPSPVSEQGMHNPPSAESLAPFYQDPAQRIIALRFQSYPGHFIVRVGALLELFKDREGTEIGWDEWKDHLVDPSSSSGTLYPYAVQVSGCRLVYFWSTAGDPGLEMEVFDFSMQGRAGCLRRGSHKWLGETMSHLSSAEGRVQIPLEGFVDL
jgi:hypothetical protein